MSSDAWKKVNTYQCNIRFVNKSKLTIALKKAAKEKGVKEAEYIRDALKNQLVKDGYLKE